jgi:hypothetical protein
MNRGQRRAILSCVASCEFMHVMLLSYHSNSHPTSHVGPASLKCGSWTGSITWDAADRIGPHVQCTPSPQLPGFPPACPRCRSHSSCTAQQQSGANITTTAPAINLLTLIVSRVSHVLACSFHPVLTGMIATKPMSNSSRTRGTKGLRVVPALLPRSRTLLA